MAKTGIEWTETTWNPTSGCSIVSPGCSHCYAMSMAHRMQHNPKLSNSAYRGVTRKTKGGPVWTGRVNVSASALVKPLRWRKPRLVFVNSMSDVFHEELSTAQIARIWAVMAIAKQHTFQVLTKRPERMLAWLSDSATKLSVELAMRSIDRTAKLDSWPLRNVWCGTSVEDQRRADERIPIIAQVPAAVRFLSMEPLLSSVQLRKTLSARLLRRIDWVIVGGESGPKSRPMHPQWAQQIRDDCLSLDISFFFKQVGSWAWVRDKSAKKWLNPEGRMSATPIAGWQGLRFGSKKSGGRKLDGRMWEQLPSAKQAPLVSARQKQKAA
jgi:protein gp37